MKFMYIDKLNNSFGSGYYINAYGFGVSYYGYSLREAIRKHRVNFNCKGKHFITVKGW